MSAKFKTVCLIVLSISFFSLIYKCNYSDRNSSNDELSIPSVIDLGSFSKEMKIERKIPLSFYGKSAADSIVLKDFLVNGNLDVSVNMLTGFKYHSIYSYQKIAEVELTLRPKNKSGLFESIVELNFIHNGLIKRKSIFVRMSRY